MIKQLQPESVTGKQIKNMYLYVFIFIRKSQNNLNTKKYYNVSL